MKPGLTLLSLLWMRKEPVSDPVDPEVLDRAVEEGRESVRTGMHVNTTQGYQEQEFRAIAAAAYRQGREDGLREAREKAEAFLNSHKVYSADDLLRSLLTDKEGEQ